MGADFTYIPKEIEKDIEKGNIQPVYILSLGDPLLIEGFINVIKKKIFAEASLDLNFQAFDASKIEWRDILLQLSSIPFLSERRLIVVKDIEKFSNTDKKRFIDYLQSPVPSSCLIATYAPKAKIKIPFNKLNKRVVHIKEGPLKEKELINILQAYAKKKGKILKTGNAKKIVRIVGEELSFLIRELEKIILFMGEKNEISGANIEEMLISFREHNVFNLTRAIRERKIQEAIVLLKRLRDLNEAPLKIINLLAREFRLLLVAKDLSNDDPGELLSHMKVPAFAWRDTKKNARLFELSEIKDALSLLRTLEVDSKSISIDLWPRIESFIMGLYSK